MRGRRRQAVDVAVDRTRRQVVDRHAGNKIQYFIKTHVTHTQRVPALVCERERESDRERESERELEMAT